MMKRSHRTTELCVLLLSAGFLKTALGSVPMLHFYLGAEVLFIGFVLSRSLFKMNRGVYHQNYPSLTSELVALAAIEGVTFFLPGLAPLVRFWGHIGNATLYIVSRGLIKHFKPRTMFLR